MATQQHSHEQVEALEKTRSQFLTVTSHKLRTPLSGMIGYVSMLLDGDFGELENEEHKERLEDVLKAGRELSGLIDTFLHVNAIDSGSLVLHFEEHDLRDFIYKQAQEFSAVAAEKDIQINVDLPKEDPLLAEVDSNVEHAIVNLIDNAIRYSESGNIHIRLEKKDDTMVHIAIEDDGIGLSAEDERHMFEKFSRGENGLRMHPNGSGLGLYIGKQIIEGHDGKIWIENKGERKGLVVHVQLPLEQSAEELQLEGTQE